MTGTLGKEYYSAVAEGARTITIGKTTYRVFNGDQVVNRVVALRTPEEHRTIAGRASLAGFSSGRDYLRGSQGRRHY